MLISVLSSDLNNHICCQICNNIHFYLSVLFSKRVGNMQEHYFLSFLPPDNDFARGQALCQEMSQDFQSLLKLNPTNFWRTIANNKSLYTSLESFLRNCQRPYDYQQPQSTGVRTMQSLIGKVLARRVFLLLLRIATTAEEGKGAPSREQRLYIIRKSGVLSLPILLDACAVFSTTNADLLSQMIQHLFRSQPVLLQDLFKMGPVIAQNLTEVALRCKEAMDVGTQSAGEGSSSTTSPDMQEHCDVEALLAIRDAVDYMRDTCQTLSSFMEIFPDAAAVLIAAGEDLVDPLASIYDDLLPDILDRVQAIQTRTQANYWVTEVVQLITQKCRHIELVLLLVVGNLIKVGYLADVSHLIQQFEQTNSEAMLLKDPVLRGEALMNCLMNIAQPEISQRDHGTALLMQTVNNRFNIDQLAVEASERGFIYLDIQQLDYLLIILGSTRSLTSLKQDSAAAISSSSKQKKDKKGKLQKPQNEMEQAVINSRIQQIKEIFPDYGEGFLECCLEVYGNDPEQVIDHLLTGNLAGPLKSLDTGLKVKPEKEQFPQLGRRSDNVLVQQGNNNTTGISNKNEQQKKKVSKSVAKALDLQNYADKDEIRKRAEVAVLQWEQEQDQEYDDEYDDTYDDAIDAGLDGAADIQGDQAIQAGRSSNNFSSGDKPKKMWVMDGKIYNYKKAGASEVKYKDDSNKQLAADAAAIDGIMGMGPGGNKEMIARQQAYQKSMNEGESTQQSSSGNVGRGRGGRQIGQRRKDRNKHAIANHHRKEGALRKMGRGM
eukprot:TRINITY_DN7801_c2_g1_i1.p1 TRINITY_DN7801_c2_g1~~TRINITY_DN7801_c2_g1_i1.p1  ORF type:complete len:773 (+),score=84.90 TRINITY_DN7801_c2_g1_i1:3-2321(+)